MSVFTDIDATIVQLKHELEVASIAARPVRHSKSVSPSSIGHECAAYPWNKFRWIKDPSVPGRISRVFEVGDSQEPYLRNLLEKMGWEFKPAPLDSFKGQHKITDFNGHMNGFLDDIASHEKHTEGKNILLEYKTYHTKRFVNLVNKKVALADFKYYVQCQLYMKYAQLETCLFVAINKNDSAVYFEIIPFNDNVAKQYIERANSVINSQTQLRKISNKSTHHVCKICEYYSNCHESAPVARNCRSCANCHPSPDQQWYCTKWESIIPKEAILTGCDAHQSII